jgi:glycosyltransferase involved in cell wall biosynthesis
MNLPEARQSPIDLTVLVTCYNEEKYIVGSLEAVVSAAKEVGISYEIIVIDDCSTDGSVARVQEYLRQHPEYPIALHRNEVNRGFANNYVDGAFLGRGKYYHLACGDDSMPKEHLVAAYRLVGKADMIVPYQIQREVAGKSPSRKIISRVFTRLVNLLSGYHLKYYNGLPIQVRYNVMRWHPVSYGFGFQADIITMLLDQGVSYTQVYSQSIDKKGSGSTSLSLRNFLSVCHTLLEIFFRRIRRMLYGKDWPKPVEIKLPESEETSVSACRTQGRA